MEPVYTAARRKRRAKVFLKMAEELFRKHNPPHLPLEIDDETNYTLQTLLKQLKEEKS